MNTETAATTAPEQHPALAAKYRRLDYVAGLIVNDVEQAPMSYVSDGGERAHQTALRIERMHEHDTIQRANQILEDLREVLKAGRAHAAGETAHARMIGDAHAGDYNEGRAKGYAAAAAAVLEAQAALHGNTRGNTRQENAQAFAETIINGTPNTTGDTQ